MNAWLKKLRCPKCSSGRITALPLRAGEGARPYGAWGVRGVKCLKCSESYPVVKPGILRMIPKGDYSRYAYWEKIHARHSPAQIVEIYKRRFAYREGFLLSYYSMPRLARKLGWKAKDSIELGCQWGSNSLSLHRFGLTGEVWLLDISVTALKGALAFFREFGVTPYAMQGEIHGLPFKDEAFELSLSGGLYEHFVGQEQEDLIAENCRISRKVLCQVPESSLAYKIYRKLVEWKFGEWPFGFEVPVSYSRLKSLFEKAGDVVLKRDYHNLASAGMMVLGERWKVFQRFGFRPFFFFLFRHDAVIAAIRRRSR